LNVADLNGALIGIRRTVPGKVLARVAVLVTGIDGAIQGVRSAGVLAGDALGDGFVARLQAIAELSVVTGLVVGAGEAPIAFLVALERVGNNVAAVGLVRLGP
jgi:hypothetical protein